MNFSRRDKQFGASNLAKEFAFFLNDGPDNLATTQTQSHVSFGWHNLSLIGEHATWNFISILPHEDFWTLPLHSFKILSDAPISRRPLHPLHTICSVLDDCRVIVDTGSSGIGIPAMFHDKILAILTEVKIIIYF